MRIENNKVEKVVFGVFLGFGVLFFALGILISALIGKKDKNDYVQITAVVSDIERFQDRHSVYIDYEYEGQQFRHVGYNMYTSSMRVGKEIKVLVSKYDPTDFYIGNFSLIFLLAFGGFGVLFGLIGGIPLAIIQKKANHKKKLKAIGQALWGTIEEVNVDYHVQINGTHPKFFVVKYEDDGIVTATSHYKSDRVFINGAGEEFIGRNIKIFVNPQDRSDYVVDLESVQSEDQYYGF